ncbi:hypothetical protein Bca4012_003736 [Brassica carinata]
MKWLTSGCAVGANGLASPGIWQVDNVHMVDRNPWVPTLTSIVGLVRSGVLFYNTRKAVGRFFFDADGDLIS